MSSSISLRSNAIRAAVAVLRSPIARRPSAGRIAGRTLSVTPAWLLPGSRAALLLRRSSVGLAAIGNVEVARSLVAAAAKARQREVAHAAHQLLLDMGEIDTAKRLAPRTGDQAALLETDRHLARGDLMEAEATLDAVDEQDNPDTLRRRLSLLSSCGRPGELLELVERVGFALPSTVVAAVRFDALWALGQAEQALAVIDAVGPERWNSVELIRRRRLAERSLAIASDELDTNCTDGLDSIATAMFEMDRIDDLVALGHQASDTLRPTGRYQVARGHYVRREFGLARQHTRSLIGTGRHWDGEKLDARMLLEEGSYREALSNRRTRTRFRQTFDEVEYFALLQLGRHDEAFASYVHSDDVRRLTAVFGHRADLDLNDNVDRRFVVAQNGPGDEVLLAATYRHLRSLSDELHVACDPRLFTLLQRAFPDVLFHPSERLATQHQLGFLAADRPRRASGSFFDLLTEQAFDVAMECDRVALGRSLIPLTPPVSPFANYLSADTTIRGEFDSQVPENAVGLLWRSEHVDAMRSIHYFSVGDLAPLAGTGRTFVCLQHDVRDDERQALTDLFAHRIVFLDHLDLRNDFEVAAAIVSCCIAVVAPGTTMIELAAALGIPAIMLHPNRIGAWRAAGGDHDYWHRTMHAAVATSHTAPLGAIERAIEILSTLFPADTRL